MKEKIKYCIILFLCIAIIFFKISLLIIIADKQYAINNYMHVQEEKTELLKRNVELQNKADTLQSIVEQDNITNNSDTKE